MMQICETIKYTAGTERSWRDRISSDEVHHSHTSVPLVSSSLAQCGLFLKGLEPQRDRPCETWLWTLVWLLPVIEHKIHMHGEHSWDAKSIGQPDDDCLVCIVLLLQGMQPVILYKYNHPYCSVL